MTISPSHHDILQRLVGLQCCDVRVIAGGTLILYIGNRDPATELTEWRLHVDSAWRIEGPSSPVLSSLDFPVDDEPHETFLSRLNSIRSDTIETISVDSPVHDLTVCFSDGHVLSSFAHFSNGEHWELRHSSGVRITMNDMTEVCQHQESPDVAAD